MEIRRYDKTLDEQNVMEFLHDEGDEWICYWGKEHADMYRNALAQSITYVAYEGNQLCAYVRSLNDCGFYVYVCDLLVRKADRGNQIGRKLMENIVDDYPNQTVYVMSDVDEYYTKQGYHREGSVFEVVKRVDRAETIE